jgi:hypothetical protein
MVSSAPSLAPKQSKIPAYSWFFQILIKQKWTETRVPKLVYFNTDRWVFYSAEAGDSEEKFRGPHTVLSVVWAVQGGAITFPSNREYEVVETISPVNSDSNGISERTRTALEVALAGAKPIYHALSTSPDYFPLTWQPPANIFKR